MLAGRPRWHPVHRFFSHVEPVGECWVWTGAQTSGYGRFSWREGQQTYTALAHRWIYERLCGPIPNGLTLDHVAERCTTTLCVNPAHLEPVTGPENTRRYRRAITARGQR